MKKFIKKILIFIVPFIVFSYPLDLIMSNILKSKCIYTGEYEVWNDIFDGQIDAKIAIYGSSRALKHFNTMLIEKKTNQKTYNFGIDGHNFWLQYLRHKEYFKYNRHPQLIIYSIDIFTLAKKNSLYNFNQFIPYMLFNSDLYRYTRSYNKFNLSDYYIPLKRYFGNVTISDFIAPNIKIRYNGFMGVDKAWNYDLEKAKIARPNYRARLDSTSILLFKQFINELERENISLIFVYTPEYIKGQDFVKNRDEIISYFYKISKQYNIPFLNYSKSNISYDKSLFYNTLHLNKKGADVFTTKVMNDLEEMGLLSQLKY